MKKLIFVNLVVVILFALLFTGCSDVFDPFCPNPDASKISANRGTMEPGEW
ncbi:MAG: hypothetical protein U9N08_03440 [Candidatus Caldatribacteriota bacterium]|nr:hypothetical protein [Candidatus Caldatribacteriota bacterium]